MRVRRVGECQALIEEFLSLRTFGGDGMVVISKSEGVARAARHSFLEVVG